MLLLSLSLTSVWCVVSLTDRLRLQLGKWLFVVDASSFYVSRRYTFAPGDPTWSWHRFGVSVTRGGDADIWQVGLDTLSISTCVPVMVGTASALLLFFWSRAAWRTARGVCAACGYSLRGNVSGKCPECGTPVPSRGPLA